MPWSGSARDVEEWLEEVIVSVGAQFEDAGRIVEQDDTEPE